MATYKVTGMSCQGCVKAVTNALTTKTAGASVEIELEGGLVKVDGMREVDVRDAVEDAGFTFEGAA